MWHCDLLIKKHQGMAGEIIVYYHGNAGNLSWKFGHHNARDELVRCHCRLWRMTNENARSASHSDTICSRFIVRVCGRFFKLLGYFPLICLSYKHTQSLFKIYDYFNYALAMEGRFNINLLLNAPLFSDSLVTNHRTH